MKDEKDLFREFKEFDNQSEEKDLLDYIGDFVSREDQEDFEEKPPKKKRASRKRAR